MEIHLQGDPHRRTILQDAHNHENYNDPSRVKPKCKQHTLILWSKCSMQYTHERRTTCSWKFLWSKGQGELIINMEVLMFLRQGLIVKALSQSRTSHDSSLWPAYVLPSHPSVRHRLTLAHKWWLELATCLPVCQTHTHTHTSEDSSLWPAYARPCDGSTRPPWAATSPKITIVT